MEQSNYIQITTYCKKTKIDRDFVQTMEKELFKLKKRLELYE